MRQAGSLRRGTGVAPCSPQRTRALHKASQRTREAVRYATGAAPYRPHLAPARGPPLRRPSTGPHPPPCATSPSGSSHSTKEGPAGTAPCKHVGATLAVRIRRATPDDSPALASLDASCAADGSSGWSEGIYRTDLQPGGPNLILVAEAAEAAEVGEESIGSAAGGDGSGARCSTAGGAGGLLALAAGSEAGGEVSLTNVAVAAACRGAGLGRRITVELLRRLGSERCTSFLEVRVDNAAAQALYARLGFAVAGRRKRYNPDGSDSFVMTRPPGPLS